MKPATKPTRKKRAPAPLKISSVSLTADDAGVLAAVAHAASDQLGRTISASAALRSVVRLVGQGMLPEPAIIEAIEGEITEGRIWGTKKRNRVNERKALDGAGGRADRRSEKRARHGQSTQRLRD